jgi:hypothetical protein
MARIRTACLFWFWGAVFLLPRLAHADDFDLDSYGLEPGQINWARPNRVSMSIGFGMGRANQTRFHRGVAEYTDAIAARSPTLMLDRVPRSEGLRTLDLLIRYYGPRHFFAETGFVFMQNGASTRLSVDSRMGSLSYENLVVEMPMVFGLYYCLKNRFYLSGGVGPSLFLFNQSDWSYDLGRISSFRAARGGGVNAIISFEWLLSQHFGIGVTGRYRYAKSSSLYVVGDNLPPVQPLGELDMSGVGMVLGMRVYGF